MIQWWVKQNLFFFGALCFVHFKNLIFLYNTENRYFIFKETHKNFIYAKNNKQDEFVYVMWIRETMVIMVGIECTYTFLY